MKLQVPIPTLIVLILWSCSHCQGQGSSSDNGSHAVPNPVTGTDPKPIKQPTQAEEEEEEPAGAGTGAEAEQVVGGLAAVLGAADLLLTVVGGNPNRNQGINTAITQLFNLTHQAEQAGNFVRTQVQAADTLGQNVWKLFGLNPPPSLLGGGAAQTGNQTTLFGLG